MYVTILCWKIHCHKKQKKNDTGDLKENESQDYSFYYDIVALQFVL